MDTDNVCYSETCQLTYEECLINRGINVANNEAELKRLECRNEAGYFSSLCKSDKTFGKQLYIKMVVKR